MKLFALSVLLLVLLPVARAQQCLSDAPREAMQREFDSIAAQDQRDYETGDAKALHEDLVRLLRVQSALTKDNQCRFHLEDQHLETLLAAVRGVNSQLGAMACEQSRRHRLFWMFRRNPCPIRLRTVTIRRGK